MENLHENCYDTDKRQLNLSHRNLRSLDAAIITSYADCTEYLDVSHNRIRDLTWLYDFPHLKCLIMDDNRLREPHFDRLNRPLTKIHTLMLNKNELSDLKTTAGLLQRVFPNVQYLSLHGNAMCPDNLLLQPFCEFVPYEYNHYRTVLLKSLPNLKFLDHYSLDPIHSPSQTAAYINQQEHPQRQQLLTSTSKDLWSKLKSFLTVNTSQTLATTTPATSPAIGNNNCVMHCGKASSYDTAYRGINSEGNRFITNSDL